jgi:plasmid stabilization system protein ParE
VPELEWLALARADLYFPKIGRPGRIEGTRELVVWANYIIVYQEDAFSIQILRVLHAAQQWPPPH